MNKAEVGDSVRYNGELKYAQNYITKKLMKQYLVEDNLYTVIDVVADVAKKSKYYYKIIGCGGWWYPSDSFFKNYRDCMINRYGLK